MGGERRAATSTLHERVGRAVERELTEAAAARWEAGPEVFLWRARRCAEAMLYALLAQQKVDIGPLGQQNKTLDELLKHDQLKGALPREMRTHFDLVRQYGNTATHFLAASCIPWAFAHAYCQWKHGDIGELPTRAEWSRVDVSDHRLRYPPGTREWTADPPSGRQGTIRGNRSGSGFVWSSADANGGDRSVSFRCVLRPMP